MQTKTHYTQQELQDIFNGEKVSPQLDFQLENMESIHAIGNLSISGVQEKASAVVDKGKIRLAQQGEQGTHLLKPAPMAHLPDRKEIPANEYLTMQIAHLVYGIKTAKNTICYTSDHNVVYITKRFDVQANGHKYMQEDFSVLTHHADSRKQDFKYSGSYENIALAIQQIIPAFIIALDDFFKLIVFNYIFGNGDAHLKNFSILTIGKEVVLAPAYDLINTALHIEGEDLALEEGLSPNIEKSDIYEQTGHPCKTDFERFGQLINLPSQRIQKTIQQFSVFPETVYQLIDTSYLSTEKLKRKYRHIIEERRRRFIRASE